MGPHSGDGRLSGGQGSWLPYVDVSWWGAVGSLTGISGGDTMPRAAFGCARVRVL